MRERKEELPEDKKCERCKTADHTCYLFVKKHGVHVGTQKLCGECFDHRIVGGD